MSEQIKNTILQIAENNELIYKKIGATSSGEGENSTIIGNGTASGDNSTVIGSGIASGEGATVIGDGTATGDYAVAFGKDTMAGCMGYYIAAIDPANNHIYLHTGEDAVIPAWDSPSSFYDETFESGYQILNDSDTSTEDYTPNGNEFSVSADGYFHWAFAGNVTEISGNRITYASDTLNSSPKWLSNVDGGADPCTFFIPVQPNVGLTNIGLGSHSEGWETHAAGQHSHAEGYGSIVAGRYGHAEGDATRAGFAAHSEGNNTFAKGLQSHSEGHTTQAIGDTSHAEGTGTIANGTISHTEGYHTVANGSRAHAEGDMTLAEGYATHAEGMETKAMGEGSHAEGYGTKTGDYKKDADGNYLDADGNVTKDKSKYVIDTDKLGKYAHAEGNETTASSLNAHAEGYKTVASGAAAHAEGNQTIASGFRAHAEGLRSEASGLSSHAEGGNTKSIGERSHAEGYMTIANGANAHTEGGGYNIVRGPYHCDIDYGIDGWYGQAQSVFDNEQEYLNSLPFKVGDYIIIDDDVSTFRRISKLSVADDSDRTPFYWAVLDCVPPLPSDLRKHFSNEPYFHVVTTTTASGISSHAEGNTTKALGDYSHAEGDNTIASGTASHAEGVKTQATVAGAHAEGEETKALSAGAHAEGKQTVAKRGYSHAEGGFTRANGPYSHAEGLGTEASGVASHAEGKYNIIDTEEKYAHIVGNGTEEEKRSNAHTLDWEGNAWFAGDVFTGLTNKKLATEEFVDKHYIIAGQKKDTNLGKYATAEGYNTEASGYGTHAEGTETVASSHSAHAEGGYSQATNQTTHAEGFTTIASGVAAHSEGYKTTAIGNGAHAENRENTAEGDMSHAEGYLTLASADVSHAEGMGTIAASDAQHAQGKYNLMDGEDKYAHIVGNGESDEKRSNAHTLDWEGNAWFAGDVYVGNTSQDDGDKLIKEKYVLPQKTITNLVLEDNIIPGKTFTRSSNTWKDDANYNTVKIPCKAGETFYNLYSVGDTNTSKVPATVVITFIGADGLRIDAVNTSTVPVNGYFTVPNNDEIAYFYYPIKISIKDRFAIYNITEKSNLVLEGFIREEGTFTPSKSEWASSTTRDTIIIPCKAGDTFRFSYTGNVTTAVGGVYVGLATLDNSKDISLPLSDRIKGITSQQVPESGVYTVPCNVSGKDCNTISYLCYPVSRTYRDKFVIHNITTEAKLALPYGQTAVVEDKITHWQGKKWYAYGTSHTEVCNATVTGKYVPYLAELSGMNFINRGIGSQGIANAGIGANAGNTGEVKNRIMSDDGKSEADLITIEVGGNDTSVVSAGKLGNYWDTDDTTFCGCLNQCLAYLQENTNAQILVMSSPYAADTANKNRYEFNKAVEECCRYNGIEYLYPTTNVGGARLNATDDKYLRKDATATHQSELGGYIYASNIWEKLKTMPLFF